MKYLNNHRLRSLAVPAALAVLLSAAPCGAQEWARKMFDHTSHDFGVVARGAKMEHRFTLENIYEEDVRIASVRSTCGCTATETSRRHLKTWETSEIVATLDTRNFLGRKDSTITVVFDMPFHAEVQLQVHSYIRSDVVVQPGAAQFGSVNQGDTPERRLTVSYAGRGDWKIERIESENPFIESAFTETSRAGGKVTYDVRVRLTNDAPVGYLRDQLVLITNDQNPRAAGVPVAVEGVVVSPLSVRPSPLMLGVAAPDQSLPARRLVVQGHEPFRITGFECEDPRFTFSADDETKSVHLVSVTFTADSRAGQVSSKVRIATDAGKDTPLEAVLQAVIAPAHAERSFPQR